MQQLDKCGATQRLDSGNAKAATGDKFERVALKTHGLGEIVDIHVVQQIHGNFFSNCTASTMPS